MENPSDNVLKRQPFKRHEYIINGYLLGIILNTVFYQSLVLTLLLAFYPAAPKDSKLLHKWDESVAEKNTIVFNTIAWM